jgi:uncharacterized protein
MAILTNETSIAALVRTARRVAVLGIKTEAQASQPAFYVPQSLQQRGLEIVPVPVYYPETTHILGVPVYRTIAAVPGEIDIVDVFRRPADLHQHLADLLEKKPRSVWLQSGIRDEAFAEALSDAGIDVVQDRCLMVDQRRWG